MGYQERDWEIVNYQQYHLDNTEFYLRGPQPQSLEKNKYFICIGAAQTFGCFCQNPYPQLLSQKFNLPVLNLGLGGAGPYFFLNQMDLFSKYINNAKFAVIQVMSGRSESNSLFDSGGMEYLTKISDGSKIRAGNAWEELLRENNKNYVKKIVAETRANWVNNYIKLLELIKIPKILFWFSIRKPSYMEIYLCKQFADLPALFGKSSANALFGKFPQLVDLEMIDQIKNYSDEYIECISRKGFPQLLISRFTGTPTTINPGNAGKGLEGSLWKYNKYYPSPEMHIDATNLLEKVCQKYV